MALFCTSINGRGPSQPSRHRRHTHPVCRLISHISSRPPVTLNVPAIPASQRTVQLGGQIEDGVAGSLASGTPYTRDETGPVIPPCPENSTLICIAQRPRSARARTCIAQRPRTYTQPTQPASCWSTACTHTTRPPRGKASPVFFLLRSASCVLGSNS